MAAYLKTITVQETECKMFCLELKDWLSNIFTNNVHWGSEYLISSLNASLFCSWLEEQSNSLLFWVIG